MESTKIYNILFLICLAVVITSCSGKSYENNQADKDVSSDSIKKDIVKEEDIYLDNSGDLSYDIIDNWLKSGLKQKIIIDSLGEPDEKGEDTYWGATGTYVQEWKYNSKGISLEMESAEQNGNKNVLMITLISPSSCKTSKLISVGSKKEDVIKAYSGNINPEFSNDIRIVVGSIYGGIIFSIDNNIVTKIFIGAAAE